MKMTKKQTILIAGATGNIGKAVAVAGEPIADLMLSHRDRSELNGALFKLYKRVDKPDKAMNDEVAGRRLWDELVLLTGIKPE
jgi:NADP-dependent 3-hydroxy acid dehydrogenase YdfG